MTEHNCTTTTQPSPELPALPATDAGTLDAVTALLAQACPDPTPPTWLPAAAAAITEWHHHNPSPAQVIANLAEQLTVLRRDVRHRVTQAVRDGEITAAGADEALRAWGLDSTGIGGADPR